MYGIFLEILFMLYACYYVLIWLIKTPVKDTNYDFASLGIYFLVMPWYYV